MKSQNPLDDDRAFDRLLRRAEWPEPQSEQIERLGERWLAIARRRRIRLRFGALAIAASILAFATVLALRHGEPTPQMAVAPRSEPVEMQPQEQSVSPPPPTVETATVAPANLSPPPVAASIEPRDPTPYERIVFLAATASRRHHRSTPKQSARAGRKTVESKTKPDALDELILALATDPAADVDQRLAAVETDLPRHEPELWGIIDRGSPERRLAAALVIARIGTARSLPVLAGLLGDPATHQTAITGLCRLARPADLKMLVTTEPNAQLRQSLFTALLARRSEESVGLYLELVRGDFRADALAASSAMADPPVDLLVAFLESPRQSVRLAAAQALGSLPEVDIAARMPASVFGGIGRQEALLALLLSPDAQSARFLDAARRDMYLVASVFAAEQQLRSLTLAER